MRKQFLKKTAVMFAGAVLLGSLAGCGKKEVVLDGDISADDTGSGAVISAGEVANFQLPAVGEQIVILTLKGYGDVKIRLFPNETEKGSENFLKLAESGFYDELIFHRVVRDFVIQGGDPRGNGTGGVDAWGSTTGFEQTISPNLSHVTGAVAYAIGQDRMNKSQFYIVTGTVVQAAEMEEYRKGGYSCSAEAEQLYQTVGGVPYLDGGYEVFGQVFDGMQYVLEAQNTAVDDSSKPRKPLVIEKAVVTEYDGAEPHWMTAAGEEFTPVS